MTYNEKYFTASDNSKWLNQLKIQLQMQQLVLEYLIRYLISAPYANQLKHCDNLLHLLGKIRFNLESINSLYPFLYHDYRFKTTINIIYRGIVDDMITISYLMCLVDLNDPQQTALSNELNILHKEFLISSAIGINSDFDFQNTVHELDINEGRPDVIDEMKKANPDLIDENREWKRNSDIRKTTDPYFLNLMGPPDHKRTSFISENKKLAFIKARGYIHASQLTTLFKYYSQYQHYSPKSIALLNHHIDYEIVSYQHVLGELLLMLDRLLDVLRLEHQTAFAAKLKELSKQVFDSFGI